MAKNLEEILNGGLPGVAEYMQRDRMSYCRFSEGDVYMYRSGDRIECCGCKLRRPQLPPAVGALALNDIVVLDSPLAALEHLAEHTAAGHTYPDSALARLDFEASGKNYRDWLADKDIKKLAGET